MKSKFLHHFDYNCLVSSYMTWWLLILKPKNMRFCGISFCNWSLRVFLRQDDNNDGHTEKYLKISTMVFRHIGHTTLFSVYLQRTMMTILLCTPDFLAFKNRSEWWQVARLVNFQKKSESKYNLQLVKTSKRLCSEESSVGEAFTTDLMHRKSVLLENPTIFPAGWPTDFYVS